jgi:hypothetical protein
MTPKRLKRPTDIIQRGKLIGDILTGQVEDSVEEREKSALAVARGHAGGLKGGKARADSLSPARRKAIAKGAAKKRWKKGA